MSREGSLDLLQEVEENLDIMRQTQSIKPVKVKAILENLRSSLEYLANDTYDKYNEPSPTIKRPNIYFPYGKKIFVDNFFIKSLKVNPPNSSPLYKVFTSIQDYNTGEKWLEMMCNLTNEVKHRQPISLREDNSVKDLSVSVDGFGLISAGSSANILFKNNYVNGHKLEDFTFENGNLQRSGNGIPLNIVITEEKKIRFHGNDYEVIPFIELCLIKIRSLIIEAYDELENI
ncbi:hypothetical protein SJ090_12135 [Enterobacter cloacae]|uniref:hypothetical protein n=1 Tax=Enterobacter cloacae TaxID=550 RepID=UPI0029D5C90C|nr:hypothetical protein [Enterobacter cloacae]MDX7022007.1 hypothetical protein [Enterobacter cloacae]